MILDSSTVDTDVALDADVCVVGSGAGAAVAACELAESGRSVVVVEDGPYLRSTEFTQREEVMYPRLYREGGTSATADYAVLVSQGRAVGGSTLASFCLCLRPPRQVLAYWERRYEIPGLRYEAMLPFFRRVEKRIGARRIRQEQVNANGEKLRVGSERLGYRGYLPFHNRTDCAGSGYCTLGCTYDRKGDMLSTYIPAASRAGAVIIPDCEVEQITVNKGRANGVRGIFKRSPKGASHALTVRARLVVLAAGAINSPRIWRQSRLPDAGGQVGKNLRVQPHIAVSALYPDPVVAWRGIPQGFVVDEFLALNERDAGYGFLLVPTFAFPVAAASMFPGYGSVHREIMTLYPRLGAIGILLHDHSRGRLEFDGAGPPTISYRLGATDEEQLVYAMVKAGEIAFAAGAERIFLPYNDVVPVGRHDLARVISERGLRLNDPLLISYQPQGTMRMGADPRRSVVDPFGQAHGVRNLFVCDASIFPTGVAVPPQVAVMALATRTARHIIAHADRYFGVDQEPAA